MSNTLWTPRLPPNASPIYRAVADALENDVAEGVLRDGSRLPTHRELAATLGVTPLTITRAYQEAARRGLIESTVGRGTFVRTQLAPQAAEARDAHDDDFVDLTRNILGGTEALDLDGRAVVAMRQLLRDPEYHPVAGLARHRTAARSWMTRSGLETSADRIVITPGAQQAILCILAALCRPGDTIMTEAVTYPRLVSIAELLQLRIEPVELDEEGATTASIARACRRGSPKALYLVPNFQNPTAVVMSKKRRLEIAAQAKKHDFTIIEDDVYGFLLRDVPPPIAELAPENAAFVTSTAKSISPSLRLGFASLPERLVEPVKSSLAATTAFTSTLSAELFAALVESGAADETVAKKRELIATHRRAADRALGTLTTRAHRESPHLWLELPRDVDARELADRARMRGIGISASSAFAIQSSGAPNAVRVSLGAARDARQLESAIRTIATLAADPRRCAMTVA